MEEKVESLSLLLSPSFFYDIISQCNGSSQLAGQKDPRDSCLHPVPGAGVTGVLSHARLFIRVLHI